jgi:hypothetical protein
MTAPVTHINLLQRTAPAHAVGWALAASIALTVLGLGYYGGQLKAQAHEAMRQRDEVAQQLKQVQAQVAIQSGEQAKSAQAVALRSEVDALQPQGHVAQALIDAVRAAEGGRTDEFARALTAMTGLNEPGLWLTGLTLSAGGKRMELQGEASSGASVLRYARRANDSLQPLTLRLDSLELRPGTAAAPGAGPATVSFRLH